MHKALEFTTQNVWIFLKLSPLHLSPLKSSSLWSSINLISWEDLRLNSLITVKKFILLYIKFGVHEQGSSTTVEDLWQRCFPQWPCLSYWKPPIPPIHSSPLNTNTNFYLLIRGSLPFNSDEVALQYIHRNVICISIKDSRTHRLLFALKGLTGGHSRSFGSIYRELY